MTPVDDDDDKTKVLPNNKVQTEDDASAAVINEATIVKPTVKQAKGKTPPPRTTESPETKQSTETKQPKSKKEETKNTSDTAATRVNPEDSRPTVKGAEAERALTRISQAFEKEDSSQGFTKARKDADRALKDNKIILNKRFVLDSTIGAGGMGTVYKARDLRKVEANDLNPDVAVKVLNADFQNHPDAFVTLQREASRSHILSHPNIVTVHDFDRDGDVIYMTMELLKGQGLDELLRDHKDTGLPIDQALHIISDFCVALAYAHKNNIIHSDFKPGNIFVTEDSAKILDFGIARITSDSSVEDNFDAGSLGALTPAYASLEMINREPPDARDDVYAAAIIAYELLTGRHPYEKKSADKALAEKLAPKPIENISSRQWKAIEAGLRLRRDERTASIEQFLNDLTLVRKVPFFKIASVVLLGVIGWFSYNYFFAPDKFSTVIEQTLVTGEQCFQNRDFACAIDSAKAVVKISPQHKSALDLRQRAESEQRLAKLAELSAAVEKCLNIDHDLNCANTNLKAIKQLAPKADNIASLQQQIDVEKQALFIQAGLERAQRCVTQKDYACAIEQTSEILTRDPQHEAALALRQQAQTVQQLQQQLEEQKNLAYESSMKEAKNCFKKHNYSCSIKAVESALINKPGDTSADQLLQRSQFSQQQQADDLKKAKDMLQKGQNCFKAGNYSCTIAKSESALELVPNYKPALALKKRARETEKKLKNSFNIN